MKTSILEVVGISPPVLEYTPRESRRFYQDVSIQEKIIKGAIFFKGPR